MDIKLPKLQLNVFSIYERFRATLKSIKHPSGFLYLFCLLIILSGIIKKNNVFYTFGQLSPLSLTINNQLRDQHEVFGFAPYWMFGDKLKNVDFSLLTTFAYFGVPVQTDGNLNRDDQGYITFQSRQATELFQKAHQNGTRVVMTLTLMNNEQIDRFLSDGNAQQNAIAQSIWEVLKRNIDGVNVDFEYIGDPGETTRNNFSRFVADLDSYFHKFVPDSRVTVSVYATSVKEPKLYDIGRLAKFSDGIFMMAYDFAGPSAENAIPTAPLNGYKNGKYWYDISTAVDDFLTVMPSNKLILGVPWYGYNYPVNTPKISGETNRGYYVYKRAGRRIRRYYIPLQGTAQSYASAQASIYPGGDGIDNYIEGWDQDGQVGWRAYYSSTDGTWRMLFLDDKKSLGIKYDFALNRNLGGIGMWALGYDQGRQELWDIIMEKFGKKAQNFQISQKTIHEVT